MSRYETPYYARLFREEAHNNHKASQSSREDKELLRETITKIMKEFDGDTELQERILQVVYDQGHDGHLLRRLTNAMEASK